MTPGQDLNRGVTSATNLLEPWGSELSNRKTLGGKRDFRGEKRSSINIYWVFTHDFRREKEGTHENLGDVSEKGGRPFLPEGVAG